MVPIRFDRAGIATGAFLVALFSIVEQATGIWSPAVARSWTFDRIVVQLLIVGIIYAAIFSLGHHLLRRQRIAGRWAYSALGAAATAPAYFFAVGNDTLFRAWEKGLLTFLLAIVLSVGAICGTLYRLRAGHEPMDDDPAALASAATPPAVDAPAATVQTATDLYYDGPLQVRTSAMAVLIAAVAGAALHSLTNFGSLIADPLPPSAMPPLLRNNPAIGVLYGIVGMMIPYALFVRIAHGALQRRAKALLRAYVLTGLLTPFAFGFALAVVGLGLFGPVIAAQFILPSMVAMAVYHRVAGLEPLDLPDDIVVRDRRTLIGADHPRRRMRRIVD